MVVPSNIDIDKPRYDQKTYVGRAKHFIITTNPLNLLATPSQLEKAKQTVLAYRRKEAMPSSMTVDDLWKAKNLYDSAFHPDTGEKLPLVGRMSAQVPMNTLIATGMLLSYSSVKYTILTQWFNQSFNAVVNYSNRSGDAVISTTQLLVSYVCASTGAVGTAVGLQYALKRAPPIVNRFVPFAALAMGNCINIPLMRYQELKEGTPVYDENNNKLGYSRRAAVEGITQVVLSRIFMSVPTMCLTPVVVNNLDKRGLLLKYKWLNVTSQVTLVALCYIFATPLCCAIFKQTAEIPVARIEKSVRKDLQEKYGSRLPERVVYNKGL